MSLVMFRVLKGKKRQKQRKSMIKKRENDQKERAKTHKRARGYKRKSKRKSKDPKKGTRIPKRKSKGQEKSISPYDTHVLAQLLTHDGHLTDEPITLGLTI